MELNDNEIKDIEENKKPAFPKILDVKIHYGLSEQNGEKKPDPQKILFYSYPDGSCYDCDSQQWLDKKPAVCDHLPTRDIEASEQDLISAIAHGVMDDEDYEILDKNGIISEVPKKLWENIKKLKKLHEDILKERQVNEDLNKAENEQMENKDNLAKQKELSEENVMPEENNDNIKEEINLNQRELGEDVVSQIISRALDEADDRIRQIVREEIVKLLLEETQEMEKDG